MASISSLLLLLLLLLLLSTIAVTSRPFLLLLLLVSRFIDGDEDDDDDDVECNRNGNDDEVALFRVDTNGFTPHLTIFNRFDGEFLLHCW